MKRYKAFNFEYDDDYGTGTALDIVEHDEGEFVKFDDIKHLLQNTPSNSDYTQYISIGRPFYDKTTDFRCWNTANTCTTQQSTRKDRL